MQANDQSMPRQGPELGWRRVLTVVLAMILAGAVYLYVVRGPALLLDLASGMGGMFCL